jgi:WD40 repeat protein
MANVVCQIAFMSLSGKPEEDKVTLRWWQGGSYFNPYYLSGDSLIGLRDRAQNARSRLEALVGSTAGNAHQPHEFDEGCYALARAGYELYEQLFLPDLPGQQSSAREVFQWLDHLRRADPIESLEIVFVNGANEESPIPWNLVGAIPWNLVNEVDPDTVSSRPTNGNSALWQSFWGIRYNLGGGRRVDPLRRVPLTQPSVLLVLDPEVVPDADRRQLEWELKPHCTLTVVKNLDELEKKLVSGTRYDLMYWLCHAYPSALKLSDSYISPRQLKGLLLRRRLHYPLHRGGLAFLNACRTVEPSQVGSFLDTLHSADLSGMVGTEQVVTPSYARRFGMQFLTRFLGRGEPIGKLLQDLRQSVPPLPLGLLYGVYCPPSLRVYQALPVRGEEPAANRPVDVAGPVPERAPDNHASPREDEPVLSGEPPAAREPTPLPPHPYVSLSYYDAEHRALFAGRDHDVLRFAESLDAPDTRLLVLHGESGVGKSSFLRAGVIPYIENNCVGYHFLRDRSPAPIRHPGDQAVAVAPARREDRSPIVFVRATSQPIAQLTQALCQYWSQPFTFDKPSGETSQFHVVARLGEAWGRSGLPETLRHALAHPEDPETWRQAFEEDRTLLGRLLAELPNHLPFGIVLVLDQFEEVFTLAAGPEDCDRMLDLLRHLLGTTGDFKVILSLRTEYQGRLVDALRRGSRELRGMREYLLTDFSREQILAAVTRPTSSGPIRTPLLHTAEVPAEHYHFSYAAGVPEAIADGVLGLRDPRGGASATPASFVDRGRGSALPLVQVICTQLYDLVRRRETPASKVIGTAELHQIGGIEYGLRNYVEDQVDGLVRGLRGAAPAAEGHPPGDRGTAPTAGPDAASDGPNAGRWSPGAFGWRSDERALKKVFTRLYLRQPDGTLTTDLVSEEALREHWTGRTPFAQVLQAARRQPFRLLRESWLYAGGGLKRYVSLGHDALARVAAAWDEERRFWLRLRWWVGFTVLGVSLAAIMAVLAGVAVSQQQRAETNLYFNRLRLARNLWWENNVVDADRVLEQCPESHRRWEWYYLRSMCRAYRATKPTLHGEVKALAFSPSSDLLASAGSDGTIQFWSWDGNTLKKDSPPRTGHVGAIDSIAFSPDGKLLASAGEDAMVRIWDVDRPKPVMELEKKDDKRIRCVVFRCDGRYLASGDDAGFVRIWDVEKGREVHRFNAHLDPVLSLAFSPELGDPLLVTAAGDPDEYSFPTTKGKRGELTGEMKVWQGVCAGGEKCIREIREDTGPVYGVAFKDKNKFVTGSYDARVRFWSVSEGEGKEDPRNNTLFTHNVAPVYSVAFTTRGGTSPYIASASGDRTVKVSDANVGEEANYSGREDVPHFAGHEDRVLSVAFSRDGRWLASGSKDGTIKIWDPARDRAARAFHGHPSIVLCVAFSPTGDRVASGSVDGTLKIWNPRTGNDLLGPPARAGASTAGLSSRGAFAGRVGLQIQTPLSPLKDGQQGPIHAVAFSPNGKELASAGFDGVIRLWDSSTGQFLFDMKGTGRVYSIAYSPDGKHLAAGGEGSGPQLWDVSKQSQAGSYPLPPDAGPVYGVAFHPKRCELAAASQNYVRTWDTTTGKALWTQRTKSGRLRCVAYEPEGRSLASGDEDGKIFFWDARTGEQIRGELHGHTEPVQSVAFHPDGHRLISGSSDSTMQVWDVPTGEEVFTGSHNFKVFAVAVSPDGRWIASASAYPGENALGPLQPRGKVRVWDSRAGLDASGVFGFLKRGPEDD